MPDENSEQPLVQIGPGNKDGGGAFETLRLVFTLTLAGLLSGLLIVGAYEITLPRIEANQAAALRKAVFEVLPGTKQMQQLVWKDGHLVVAGPAQKAPAPGSAIYGGYDQDGKFLGYAIPAAGPGFQDTIQLIFGFDPARQRIVGMQVLESRETPGLGSRIADDPDFHSQFKDLAVEPEVVLVKGHGDKPNDVDAITGATISSTAVVKIINTADATWLPKLPKAGNAPPLAPERGKGREIHPVKPPGGPVPGGNGGK